MFRGTFLAGGKPVTRPLLYRKVPRNILSGRETGYPPAFYRKVPRNILSGRETGNPGHLSGRVTEIPPFLLYYKTIGNPGTRSQVPGYENAIPEPTRDPTFDTRTYPGPDFLIPVASLTGRSFIVYGCSIGNADAKS